MKLDASTAAAAAEVLDLEDLRDMEASAEGATPPETAIAPEPMDLGGLDAPAARKLVDEEVRIASSSVALIAVSADAWAYESTAPLPPELGADVGSVRNVSQSDAGAAASAQHAPAGSSSGRDGGIVLARAAHAGGVQIAPSGDRGGDAYSVRGDFGNAIAPNLEPTDTLYDDQWHFDLMGNGAGGRIFIERVWDEYSGDGVTVGIYDSGVQSTHYDLDGNYNDDLHVIVGGVTLSGDPIANPAEIDAHGTAVAGIIGSENDGFGTVGVAWGSSLTGVNIFDPNSPAFINGVDQSGFFEAVYQMANFDVTNNSWGGFPNYTGSLSNSASFDAQTVAGYEYAIYYGRDGLGTNIVQSAGNDNLDANGEGIAVSRYTISVAALLETGFASSYSSFGANVLVSAAGGDIFSEYPNTVDGTRFITTTDLLGGFGFNTVANPWGPDDYTDMMNGTSSAGPMVAGVIALMLEANPDLGWRDVQNILASTAFDTGSGVGGAPGLNEEHVWYVNGATDWNNGGRHFSEDYGYGNVDPYGAVRMAEAYAAFDRSPQTSYNEAVTSSGFLSTSIAPVDGAGTAVTYQFVLGGDVQIEHIELVLGFNYEFMTDLLITLTSPDGTTVVVQTPDFDTEASIFSGATWIYGIEALRGETSAGTWTLSVADMFSGGTGTITSVELNAYGSTVPSNDVYHYTDELAGFVAADFSRTVLVDTDGGVDWMDFSAVTSSVQLTLTGGSAVSLGLFDVFSIDAGTVIENVITGDGGDTLTGNSEGNKLYGMRGEDTLYGEGGSDELVGGQDNDTLYGGSESDDLYGDGIPATPSGVGLGSGLIIKNTGAGNNSLATAIDVQNSFSLNYDVDISDSTEIPHVTIQAAGDNNKDYYKLTVAAGTVLTFDIDYTFGTFDSYLRLYDINGALVASDDDSATSFGGLGSTSTFDSFLQYTVGTAGTYIIEVARFTADVIPNGAGYELQISAEDAAGFANGSGNDTLDGGTAADRMYGGLGNDTYYVDVLGDQVFESAGQGDDRVFARATYVLAANQSIELLATSQLAGTSAINLTGNNIGQRLNGNAGNNTLDGGGGIDQLYGYGGNDTFYVNHASDQVFEATGQGDDRIFARVTYALAANQYVELIATSSQAGTAAINLTGNNIGQRVNGNAGNNTLDGGGGIDQLYGFGGNDTFYVNHANDQVIEAAGQGTDTVYARTSFALAAAQSIEVLATSQQAGTAAINLTGNELVQTIRGNAGINVLDGGGGGDQMYGLGGSDAYYVSHASDQVYEVAGQGTDTVYARVSYTLGAAQSVEVLATSQVGGTAAINLTGNELGQTLLGNAGNNVLDGMGGIDQHYGYGGDDTYYVDRAADGVFETSGQGTDTVYARVSYTLAAGQYVEFLRTSTVAGTTVIHLTGNELAQTVSGNAADNLINGGRGNDTLTGNAGFDTFVFDTTLSSSNNVDSITDFNVPQDSIRLENAIFTALTVTGTLAASAFHIGTAAADSLDRIIYNSGNGRLYYDADGSGAGGMSHFATLSTGLALTNLDFVVA